MGLGCFWERSLSGLVILPGCRGKRKKLGREVARDLNNYSWYKTLEMAAEGAGSPDF